jgi:hypothetical protein
VAALAAGCLLLLTAALKDVILLVLGPAYSHLSTELMIVAGVSGIGFIATVAGELNKARAWVIHSWLLIPAVLATQAAALCFLDVSRLRGALLFGMVSMIPSVLVALYQGWIGFRTSPATGGG